MTRALVVALLCLGSFGVSPAFAQPSGDDAARYHFRLGETHYANSNFAEAAHEFEEAYRLSERPQLLYNLYLAYRDAADLPHAADALRRYLEAVPDADGASNLRGRLAAMERTLADQPVQQGSAPPTEPATPAETATPSEEDTPTATEDESGGGSSPVPWIVGGAGVALLAGAGIFGILALGSQGTLEDMCPDRECPDDYDFESEADSGKTLATVSDVMLATGVVTVGVGVVLLMVMGDDDREESAASASLGCDPTGCSGSVTTRF